MVAGVEAMWGTINKVLLVGTVSSAPRFNTWGDGNLMATLRIETCETREDKLTNENRVFREWHQIAVFSPKLVSVIKEGVSEGSALYAEGRLKTRKWNDAAGNDRFTTEVVINSLYGCLVLLNTLINDNQGSHTQGIDHKRVISPDRNFDPLRDIPF